MPNRRRKHFSRRLLILIVCLILLIGLGIFNYLRPLPAIYPITNSIAAPITTSNPISWPSSKESAIGGVGFGVLAAHGSQIQLPIASVAKLITALTVLQKYPLSLTQLQAPLITLTSADVALYDQYVAEDGSVVNVAAGEQISEYQVLEAMLMPSANNMADSLAIWAYGSLPNYAIAANQYLKSIGLAQTTVGADASGFLPSTTSSAHDLVLLGLQALNNPIISQIVALPQTTIPVAGSIRNVNWLLGSNGIVGIKTGNTNQAGGVYLFAANDKITDSSTNVEIVGCVEGASTLLEALNESVPFLNTLKDNFYSATFIRQNQVVGSYKTPWGTLIPAVSKNNISSPLWRGSNIQPIISMQAVYAPVTPSTVVGLVEVPGQISNDNSNIVLSKFIPSAPWWWRVLRIKI